MLLAPQCQLGFAETRRLIRHVEQGGDVLVATRGPDARAVASLLAPFGVSIKRIPLGPVPVRADMDREAYEDARRAPQFRDAWSVETGRTPGTRSLYKAFEHDVVVEARGHGHRGGRLVVVGDAEFLTDSVLENEHDAWEGNVDFLAGLLSIRNEERARQ